MRYGVALIAVDGIDLRQLFIGSEGTLGVATKIIVKLSRVPQMVTCLLAAFETTGQGGAALEDAAIDRDGALR